MDQRARIERLLRRRYKQVANATNRDVTCAICLEPVTDTERKPATTICGHVFHGECWRRHTCSITDLFERRADVLTEDDLRRYFIFAYGGAPCPLCRFFLPFLDRVAYAVQDREAMEPVHEIGIAGLNLDLSLTLAHRPTRN